MATHATDNCQAKLSTNPVAKCNLVGFETVGYAYAVC